MSKFDAAIKVLTWAAESPDEMWTQPEQCYECGSNIALVDIPSYRAAIRVLEAAPKIADGLAGAERFGAEKDEPEGVRWVQISDTSAEQLAATLRGTALPDEEGK